MVPTSGAALWIFWITAVALGAVLATIVLQRYRRAAVQELNQALHQALQSNGDGNPFAGLDQEIPEGVAELWRRAVSLRSDLEQSQNHLTAILLHMDNPVLLLDTHRRISRLNPAAERLLEVPSAEAVGRPLLEILRNADLDELIEVVSRQRTADDAPLDLTCRVPAPKDPELVLSARLIPMFADNRIQGYVVLISELNPSRRLEQMRRQFVSNVSHELQSPITAIAGFSETLLEEELDDPEQVKQFLTIIRGEAWRMSRLVDDLLDLSKIESGRALPKFQAVDVPDLIRHTTGSLLPLLRRSQLNLDMEIPTDLPVIEADPDQLDQVIRNLLRNSIQYTPADGRITVRARLHDDHVEITVEDTGVGIPEKDLPRIFERFYRVDKARSRETGGTGLGLSIVKHIVEAHHGGLDVKSKVGVGTSVGVYLPIRQPL